MNDDYEWNRLDADDQNSWPSEAYRVLLYDGLRLWIGLRRGHEFIVQGETCQCLISDYSHWGDLPYAPDGEAAT